MEYKASDIIERQFDGAVRGLLFLAGQSVGTTKTSLEDEVLRFCRMLQSSPGPERFHGASAVASQLEVIADLWQSAIADSEDEKFDAVWLAADGEAIPDFLRGLAGLLRVADRELPPSYLAMPMTSWEAIRMYPSLFQFSYNISQGDFPDQTTAILARIEAECWSDCRWQVAPLVAEVHDALTRFPDEESLRANVGAGRSWVTTAVLRDIERLVNEHLASRHPGAA